MSNIDKFITYNLVKELDNKAANGVVGGIDVGKIRLISDYQSVVWEAGDGKKYTGTPRCLTPVLEEGEFAPAVCYTGTVIL